MDLRSQYAQVREFCHNTLCCLRSADNKCNNFKTSNPAIKKYNLLILGSEMFAQGGLFMELKAYVPEGGNEGWRAATPTSISIFDSHDILTL